MSSNIIVEKIKKLEENQDYIKNLLDCVITELHNIKFEIKKLNTLLSEKEETQDINDLIEQFKKLKTDPKPVKTKLNLFYSKDDINIKKQGNL